MQASINFISEFDSSVASFRSRVWRLYEYVSSVMPHVGFNDFDGDYDIIVIQKGSTKFVYEQFMKYKKQHKFIIFDIDDYHDNHHKFFIKFADLVVVGSSFLKRTWQHLNKNIAVLDDPIDVYDLNIPLKKFKEFNFRKIGWFGNTTNLPMLNQAKIPDVKTITMNGDIEWSPETVDKDIQRFDLIVLPQDIHSYYGASKGNCRMLKSLYLGVPVMVSDLPAYVDLAKLVGYPTEFILHDGEDWNERIKQIRSPNYKFKFDFENCRKIIMDNYSFAARGQQWLDIVSGYYEHRGKNRIKKILFFLDTFKLFRKVRDGRKRTIILFGVIKIHYTKRKKNG